MKPSPPTLVSVFTRLLRPLRAMQACAACGEISSDSALCAECRAALPLNACACPRCALPIPQPATACGRCLKRPPPQSRCLAPLLYAEPINALLTALKFHSRLAAGRALSELLIECAATEDLLADIEIAVPIPLHRLRLRERGYNQALELARPVLRHHRIALMPQALHRLRHTPAQSGLDALARRRNLRGAFTAESSAVAGKRVLLVDDVITTGATMMEAARSLLAAGAIEVRVLAVARVG